MIPVCTPWLPGNEKRYVSEAMETNWISSAGKYIQSFEQSFSEFCGVSYGVSCCSGYAALHLACLAIDLKKGDEVVVPTFTMSAPLVAIIQTGAKPVLVDCDPDTYCIDADKIEEKITEKTKAILAVHIYGQVCDMDRILEIANRHDLRVIEDAAEAHGAEYKGRKAGSFGDIGCFSFYGNKILTTGEGGMAVTNNKIYADKMEKLRNYAFEKPRFLHRELGVNYRMSNLHAAIGLAQTENAQMLVNARRSVGLRYNELLRNVEGIKLPTEKENYKNVFWMYGVVLDDAELREEAIQKLKERGVDTRNFFIPMHKQPVFLDGRIENVPDCPGNYPVSEKIGKGGFYLPSSSNIKEEEIRFVCENLREVLNEVRNKTDRRGEEKVVVVSGYFDPLHIGHIEYFRLAKSLGNKLVVILNNDVQARLKKGDSFMPLEERKSILLALKDVDDVFVSIDQDWTVCKSLEALKPDVFAKGGDRFKEEIPETEICNRLGIEIVDGLGEKIQSSKNFYERR